MSHGGYRDDRGEWPDDRRPQPPNSLRRLRRGSADEAYDSDDSGSGYQTRPTDHYAPARGPVDPGSSQAGPWYGRDPGAAHYGGHAEPPQQRYPDSYVAEPGGYVPDRYEPPTPYGSGPAGAPVSPGRMPPQGRPADLRGAMPPDNRPRRHALGAADPVGYAGSDVRTTSQSPIYGPDARSTVQPQPYYGHDMRGTYAQPGYDADTQYAPYAGGAAVGQQPGAYAGDGWTSRQRARTVDGDFSDTYPRAPIHSPPESPRRGRRVVALLVVLFVLAAAGTVGYIYLRNRNSSGSPSTASAHTFNTAPIASQQIDPKPLTVTEAFGASSIASAASGGPYRLVKADSATSCANAVAAQISTLVTSLGCTQGVRATMLSPDQAYVITAGILNMPDAQAATKVASSVMNDIKAGTGRFNGFAAGGNTNVITASQARVAWDTRGHYVVYCVIALTSGKAIATDDSRVPVIVDDIVEGYLANKVLAARAAASNASASPTHS